MYYRLSVALVSVYLVLVGIWLIVTQQVPAPGIKKILLSSFRPRYKTELTNFCPESGHCWITEVPESLLSDKESASRLCVFENGSPLGPAHAAHDDIRRLGGGRFSHWGSTVYFSTSDNSNPRSNGRRYTASE